MNEYGRGQGQQGNGRGGMGGPFAVGPGGVCVCPRCGHVPLQGKMYLTLPMQIKDTS